MYEIIKDLCAQKGISPTKLCTMITGSKGNLPTWQKGNINPSWLSQIADYFDVSADYLLGRTATKNGINQVNTGSVGDNSKVNINAAEVSDGTEKEMLEKFSELSFSSKIEVLQLIDRLSKVNE